MPKVFEGPQRPLRRENDGRAGKKSTSSKDLCGLPENMTGQIIDHNQDRVCGTVRDSDLATTDCHFSLDLRGEPWP